MSQWTHVVGCIRVDGMPDLGANINEIKKVLGPISTYDHFIDYTPLPTGEEGSLQYSLIEYDTGACWLAIPIWGDLRGYTSEDITKELIPWWNNLMKKLDDSKQHFAYIRDAVLHVYAEGEVPIILTHKIEE
jgi:hypothetical protein